MKMFILQFAMPTWWVTDFDALYSKTRATINVDCITNATILSISNEDREKICNEIHEVEHFFRWRTNKGYVAAQKRLLSFMNNDARFGMKNFYPCILNLYNLVPETSDCILSGSNQRNFEQAAPVINLFKTINLFLYFVRYIT